MQQQQRRLKKKRKIVQLSAFLRILIRLPCTIRTLRIKRPGCLLWRRVDSDRRLRNQMELPARKHVCIIYYPIFLHFLVLVLLQDCSSVFALRGSHSALHRQENHAPCAQCCIQQIYTSCSRGRAGGCCTGELCK